MSNAHVTQAFKALENRLADRQARLLEARAWAKLRASDGWEVMEGWLTAQIAARQQEFLSEKELTHTQTEVMRAEIRMLARMLRAGSGNPDAIKDLESEITALQAQIVSRQNRGLDRDYTLTSTQGTT